MMRERPILFSAPMIRAILASKKTRTRRVIKPQPVQDGANRWSWISRRYQSAFDMSDEQEMHAMVGECPYGVAGDDLWVRETYSYQGYAVYPHEFLLYRADFTKHEEERLREELAEHDETFRWRPSIFMRRELSRIQLRIDHVFVMRVQTLCVDSVRAEGIEVPDVDYTVPDHPWQLEAEQRCYAIDKFCELWDSINAKRGFPFRDNPWVWDIHFKRITP